MELKHRWHHELKFVEKETRVALEGLDGGTLNVSIEQQVSLSAHSLQVANSMDTLQTDGFSALEIFA